MIKANINHCGSKCKCSLLACKTCLPSAITAEHNASRAAARVAKTGHEFTMPLQFMKTAREWCQIVETCQWRLYAEKLTAKLSTSHFPQSLYDPVWLSSEQHMCFPFAFLRVHPNQSSCMHERFRNFTRLQVLLQPINDVPSLA